jgi:hypothetical protein
MIGLQQSLFQPVPCRVCGLSPNPHWLPNYRPPVWVLAHGPKCGEPVYAPSQDEAIVEWAKAQATP